MYLAKQAGNNQHKAQQCLAYMKKIKQLRDLTYGEKGKRSLLG